MKSISLLAYFVLALALTANAESKNSLEGHWVMHLYLGTQLFDNQIHIESDPAGGIKGTIMVPNRFTVPLRNIRVVGEAISFDIEADEGRGPFHVLYEGRMHANGKVFVGYATITDNNTLLGGFVAQKKQN